MKKKSQVKKKLNSVNGGRKMEKGESKKEKKGDKKSRGPILGPPLKTQQVAESTPKKKNFFFFFFFSFSSLLL